MSSIETKRLRMLVWLLVLAAMIIGAYYVVKQAEASRSELPALGNLPDFEFVSQQGHPFGRQNMLGKVNVVDFIFTRCKGPCPIMSRHMSQLYELYADADEIQFISISVDPVYDSLPVLRAYAESNGVNDSRWVFLRAPMDSVVWLSESGFMLSADDLPGSHTTRWVLVDQEAEIRGYYSGTDEASIAILKTHIADLVKARR